MGEAFIQVSKQAFTTPLSIEVISEAEGPPKLTNRTTGANTMHLKGVAQW